MQLTRERGYGAEFDPLEHSGPGQDLVHTGSVGLPLGPLVDVVAVQVLRVIRLSFPVQPGCIGSATRDPFDVDHFRVSSHLNSPIKRAGPASWSSSSRLRRCNCHDCGPASTCRHCWRPSTLPASWNL